MVSDGYVCDMGVGFGLVMLPMDFSVFPMMEKDSWKVETGMRSVKWLFVVFYITKIGITNACECANDETMVVETCGLINRCALPVDGKWWMGLWGKVPVGQGSRGQVGEIIESILNDFYIRIFIYVCNRLSAYV